ncbi:MAG: F0F1 ATP synthase subunit epsilon [Acidimicrobiales bacterium]|jgi:F-type H+-transporting ATPase subunit epsilon
MADDALFQINLVTPERILLTGMASEVMVRTGEGDATFLAGHTPLVGSVQPGVVRVVRGDGEVVRVAVHGGFTQVELNVPLDGGDEDGVTTSRVTLLIGVAELASEIDADRARAALEAAEARVAELGGSAGRTLGEDEVADPELVEAEAALLRAQVRLEALDASTSATA